MPALPDRGALPPDDCRGSPSGAAGRRHEVSDGHPARAFLPGLGRWVGNYADESHYAVLLAGGSWGPVQTLSNGNVQGAAHGLGLAVSPDGSVVVAFANSHDTIWAASGTILRGLSAPVTVANGDYSKDSAPKVALDDAGQASLVWSQKAGTEAATRSPSGTWSAPVVLSSQPSSSVATAIDGAGNAISVFGSSYSWHLAGGTWRPAAALPAGSSGGLVVADPAPSSTPTAAATRSPSAPAPPASAPAADHAAAWPT